MNPKLIACNRSYSSRMASKIGIELACLVNECLVRHGTAEFIIDQSIIEYIGSKNKEAWNELQSKGILLIDGNKAKINIDTLIDVIEDNPLKRRKQVKLFPESLEFQRLLEMFQTNLLRKGRQKKSTSELEVIFSDKTLGDSLKALRLAVNNGFVILMFNDEERKDVKGNDRRNEAPRRTWASGGSKNEGSSDSSFSQKARTLGDDDF